MRHNWITPRMGAFLAAAMLMSSLSALPPVSAAETAMTDDLLSVQGIPVEHAGNCPLRGREHVPGRTGSVSGGHLQFHNGL